MTISTNKECPVGTSLCRCMNVAAGIHKNIRFESYSWHNTVCFPKENMSMKLRNRYGLQYWLIIIVYHADN